MTDKLTPHPHINMIKAWADGHSMQNDGACGIWVDGIGLENWHPLVNYRIKPKLEYPYTQVKQFEANELFKIMVCQSAVPYEMLINLAIKDFITSGQMDEYIEQRNLLK